jgi:hypothetical protein
MLDEREAGRKPSTQRESGEPIARSPQVRITEHMERLGLRGGDCLNAASRSIGSGASTKAVLKAERLGIRLKSLG